MSKDSRTIRLNIGNVVPHGNTRQSADVLKLWREMADLLQSKAFVSALIGQNRNQIECDVSLDIDPVISLLEKAISNSNSFDGWRLDHISNPTCPVSSYLTLTLTSEENLNDWTAYQVASNFLQQMVLAANLVIPGSIQLLDTAFEGEGAHRYELQEFDSHLFYDAGKFNQEFNWPPSPASGLYTAWRWLEKCETSETNTALKDINKVLFSLLKAAQMRQEYSARTVLIVLYLLEVLLDCHNQTDCLLMRQRVKQVLGDIPEGGDRLGELYAVKQKLYMGDQPVRRPGLLSHDINQEIREELGQHFNAIEIGVAVALGLLHKLIMENGTRFVFTESYSCR